VALNVTLAIDEPVGAWVGASAGVADQERWWNHEKDGVTDRDNGALQRFLGTGGNDGKAAVSSQPDKSVDKAKAKVHKAKAHHHAKAAKDAAKDIPK
jgi:hypothetical protein